MTVNGLIKSLTTLIEQEGPEIGDYEVEIRIGKKRDVQDWIDVFNDTKIVLLR